MRKFIKKTMRKLRKGNNPKDGNDSVIGRISLQQRLFIVVISLLVAAITIVGFVSYTKAKGTTISMIENRLVREVETIAQTAQFLTILHGGNQEAIEEGFEESVQKQRHSLMTSGIKAQFFYIEEEGITPFKVNKNSNLEIPENILAKISKDYSGVLHDKINNEDYTFVYQYIPHLTAKYLLAIPTKTYMESIYSFKNFILLFASVIILISIIFIVIFVRSLTKPLSKLRIVMREVRNGNFDQEINIHSTVPEIRSLVTSFNQMLDQMNLMIREIYTSSNYLNNQGNELRESTEQAKYFNDQLMEAIKVVRMGAEQTASSSDTSIHTFQEMNKSVTSVLLHMKELYSSAEDMNHSAEKGDNSIGKLIDAIKVFERDFTNMTATINDVKNHSVSISDVVTIIKQIADQTKLLALNAAIESTRVGEAGKGFAVVAEEIRKLAEQSSEATNKIADSITKMEDISVHASLEFDEMLERMQTQLNAANDSKSMFDMLMYEINKMNTKLSYMESSLQSLDQSVPEMEVAAKNFSAISQETLASAEQMELASTSHHRKMGSVYDMGGKILQVSNDLQKKIQGLVKGKEGYLTTTEMPPGAK